jgi:hypothetical protein
MTEHTIYDAQGAMQMIHFRPGLKLRIAGFKPGKKTWKAPFVSRLGTASPIFQSRFPSP